MSVQRGAERQAIHDELAEAGRVFHLLVAGASEERLRQRSNGTRWTNGQLLFHMVFGYMIVLRLLPLVRLFGRLPEWVSRRFAALLNGLTRPFHVVNYLGSCGGALVFHGPRLVAKLDRTLASLQRHLDQERDATMTRQMHFPVDWDPFFSDTMDLLEVYHYGTQHFDFHRRQLTL